MTKTINKLFSNALLAAETTHTCSTCKFAKLQQETGNGYCGYESPKYKSMHPLHINEDYTCKHWKTNGKRIRSHS